MLDYLENTLDYNEPDIASIIDELSLWAARFGMLMLDQLEPARNLKVLDIGCGTGFPLFELAHLYGNSCQFTGVDLWEAGLNRAALKLKLYGLENVTLVKADASDLPLAAAHFDLIVSNLGLNNFEKPQAVLTECARVAKRGAQLSLTTNVKGHFQEFYAVYRDLLAEFGQPEYLERLAANENHRLSKEIASQLVEQAGFRVSKIIEDQFQMRFADGSALLRHSLVRIGFLDGWRAVIKPEDEKKVFGELESRLNLLAERQGGLTMTIPRLYLEASRK